MWVCLSCCMGHTIGRLQHLELLKQTQQLSKQFANCNMWYCKCKTTNIDVHTSLCMTKCKLQHLVLHIQKTQTCASTLVFELAIPRHLINLVALIHTNKHVVSTFVVKFAIPFANYHVWYRKLTKQPCLLS